MEIWTYRTEKSLILVSIKGKPGDMRPQEMFKGFGDTGIHITGTYQDMLIVPNVLTVESTPVPQPARQSIKEYTATALSAAFQCF